MTAADTLCGLSLFSDIELDEHKKTSLNELMQIRQYEPGQYVYKEGERPDGFYILADGIASISALGLDRKTSIFLGVLKSGEWFGDLEIHGDLSTRTSSVQVSKKSVALYVPSTRFRDFLMVIPEVCGAEFEKVARMRTGSYLKTLPFFSFLLKKSKGPLMIYDEDRINLLGDLFSFVSVKPKTMIFRQGDIADALYVVADGSVIVSAPIQEKSDMVLATLGAGEVFGELALLGHTIRTASITTGSKSDNFQNFMSIVPEVAPALQALAERRTANSLKKIPLFDCILENKPWSKLDLLGALFTFESYPPNTVFVEENVMEKKFMIVIQGEARSTISIRGQDAELEILRPGSWIGEHSLIESEAVYPKISSLHEHILLLTLSSDKFSKFLKVVPEMLPQIQDVIRRRRAKSIEVSSIGPSSAYPN